MIPHFITKRFQTQLTLFTMAYKGIACYISKSVTPEDEKQNKAHSQTILNNMVRVRTDNNQILNAILDASSKWNTSPIIWVSNNTPYKIKLIERTEKYVILHQCAIRYKYSNSGKETYTCIAKRHVKLTF